MTIWSSSWIFNDDQGRSTWFPQTVGDKDPSYGLWLDIALLLDVEDLDDDKNGENYISVMVSKSVMSVETMVVGIMMEEMILAKMFATSST